MARVVDVFREYVSEEAVPSLEENGTADLVDVFHNGIWKEEHFEEELFVHRKGAAPAHAGQLAVVPGSMGTCSFLVEGRGNHYSFCSVSHGAGRTMSRNEAQRRIGLAALEKSMAGVAARLTERHVEEAPAAYKDVHRVMRYQKDLVTIRLVLSPLISVKG
jgi:tRNA-splicing ligase RtcB